MRDHLLGRQGEVEDLQSQLAESKAENESIEDKYSDLAAEMEELQQKLASEVSDYQSLNPVLWYSLSTKSLHWAVGKQAQGTRQQHTRGFEAHRGNKAAVCASILQDSVFKVQRRLVPL